MFITKNLAYVLSRIIDLCLTMADEILRQLLCCLQCCRRHDSDHLVQRPKENKRRVTKRCSNCTLLEQQNERLQQKVVDLSSPIKEGCMNLAFEDLNDKFSNTQLRKRFQQIRTQLWLPLCKSQKTCQDELHAVQLISDIMKKLYEECKQEADRRLMAFTFSHWSPDKIPDVYEWRRILGQEKFALQEITRVIKERYSMSDQTNEHRSNNLDLRKLAPFTKTSSDEQSTGNSSMLRNMGEYPGSLIIADHDTLERFVDAFVECSWLMIIAVPPIELHFDVLGEVWDANVEERFEKHSSKQKVVDNKVLNTITQVVWPELDDKHGIHVRGAVVTVDANYGTEV